MAIIETKNLTFTYAGRELPSIKDVTLSIGKGEFVILTGPSGCGKTTLCRCFNGLIPHFYNGKLEGEVVVAGLKVDEHQTYELARHVGLVFQNPENQLFALSVEKDVAFGLENLGLPREEIRKTVDWAMKTTGIYELKDRAPYELSGGQQQRLCIARTIAVSPEVILMDEPCSALDPIATAVIEDLIAELKTQYSIVIVTHSMQQASRVSQRTAYFHLGDLIEVGPTERIFTNPRHQLTQDYITGRFG